MQKIYYIFFQEDIEIDLDEVLDIDADIERRQFIHVSHFVTRGEICYQFHRKYRNTTLPGKIREYTEVARRAVLE